MLSWFLMQHTFCTICEGRLHPILSHHQKPSIIHLVILAYSGLREISGFVSKISAWGAFGELALDILRYECRLERDKAHNFMAILASSQRILEGRRSILQFPSIISNI